MPVIRTRKYKTNCKTCMFMKGVPYFRERIYASRRFDPNSHESIVDVCMAYPGGPTIASVYTHIKNNHLGVDYESIRKKFEQKREREQVETATEIVKQTGGGVQVEQVIQVMNDKAPYVAALDNYIALGMDMLKEGKLSMTPNTFIAAINARAAIEKGNKDRTADLVKTLAVMAAPKPNNGS